MLATLHDLLFERRWGDVGGHGRAAAKAYVAILEENSTLADVVDAADRTFALIRITRNDDLVPAAVGATLKAVRAALAERDDPKPGVSLRLLEILVSARVADTTVDELLGRCRAEYTDAWNTVSTIKLQRRRAADADARRALDRQEVQAWLDEAQRRDPLVAIVHLETAAKLAQQLGLTDLADEAVRAMQRIDPADIPLQEFSAQVEIPRAQIEAHIDQLLEAESWFHAAVRIIASGPPSGDVEENRQTAESLAQQFPLQALFPKVRLGSDGLPRYRATTDEEQADDRLADQEVMRIRVGAFIRADAFDRAAEKFGAPTADDVIAALGNNPDLDDATKAGIARVIDRYYKGDPEGACYTGVPLVERLTRELLLAIDSPVYRTQSQRTPGQYPGLGALLVELSKRGLDTSWYRYLRTLLASPNGLNLRNEALHGFVDEVGREMAAAVLAALIYLASLRTGAQ